jgi:hypothetical protein
LPSNYVRAIAIDGQGNKWIGTLVEGLQSLMELIGLFITLQILDCLLTMLCNSHRWTREQMDWNNGGGLAKFDGVNWTVYNTSNSGLPSNYVLQ